MSKIIYHSHHIIPKHAGGTDASDNIARLTVEEHSEAHRLLYEKYNRWQDKLAWQGLAGHIGKEEIISQSISNARIGVKHTPEAKEKMSNALKGKVPWNKGKTNCQSPPWNKGRTGVYTEEQLQSFRDGTKNQKRNSKGHFTK
jgi:hypothetical protein